MIDNLRLIELFAGYGSQALALKYLNIPFEHHFVCEFDKYAIQSYNDIHGTNFEVSDIRNISADDLNITDTDKYKYLMTYSFPCTDLSLAGKQRGMQRQSGTASSLLWEVERLLKECKELPQYLLMENVPQVISKDNIKLFGEWTTFLTGLGYRNYYKLLNAKDFGVPQNRERCFMVSILKSENMVFTFPTPKPLDKRLKDVLEPYEEVDEKYYIKSEKAQKLIQQLIDRGDLPDAKTISVSDQARTYVKKTEISHTIKAGNRGWENQECNAVVELGYIEKGTGKHQSNTVYDVSGVSPTLASQYLTNIMENKMYDYVESLYVGKSDRFFDGILGRGIAKTIMTGGVSAVIQGVNKLGNIYRDNSGGNYAGNVYDKEGVAPALNTSQGGNREPMLVASRGRDPQNPSNRSSDNLEQRLEINRDGLTNTLTTVQKDNYVLQQYQIRKLTPKECFRLMGVKDEDYDKLTVSNTQRYKQAGNSIVVDVLMAIFENMFVKECKSNRLF